MSKIYLQIHGVIDTTMLLVRFYKWSQRLHEQRNPGDKFSTATIQVVHGAERTRARQAYLYFAISTRYEDYEGGKPLINFTQYFTRRTNNIKGINHHTHFMYREKQTHWTLVFGHLVFVTKAPQIIPDSFLKGMFRMNTFTSTLQSSTDEHRKARYLNDNEVTLS